jgi:hypothetical protein
MREQARLIADLARKFRDKDLPKSGDRSHVANAPRRRRRARNRPGASREASRGIRRT